MSFACSSYFFLLLVPCRFLFSYGFVTEDIRQVFDQFHAVILHTHRLVVLPVVVGLGLEQNRFGVSAVGKDGDDGEDHGEDRGKQTDLLAGWVGLAFDFVVDFQFSHGSHMVKPMTAMITPARPASAPMAGKSFFFEMK